MDYDKLKSISSWIEIHRNILDILETTNDGQNKGTSRKRFFEQMKLETKLEQRQIEFQQTFGERKTL